MDKQTFLNQYAVDRRGTRSLKWDLLQERFGNPDLLPLWVGDMDFKVSDAITQSLQDRVAHGVYGYSFPGSTYYSTVSQWLSENFQFPIKEEWVRFSTGVVQALHHLIHAFTQEEDAVLILTPVYYPFHDAVNDTKRKLVTVDLKNQHGYFTIDFDAVEEAIKSNQVKLFIHCSPHNPAGRVWTVEEQERLLALCDQYDVLVISDEIHQDFIFGNTPHIPSANVKDKQYRHRVITTHAASKTFNLAALTHAHIIITDEELRAKFDRYANTTIKSELNIMGLLATEAAYSGGHEWLASVKEVIYDNYLFAREQLKERLPEIIVYPLEGTYLMLIDLNPILAGRNAKTFMQDECGLAIDYGEWFGEGYEGFIRINLATHPENVKNAIQAIVKAG